MTDTQILQSERTYKDLGEVRRMLYKIHIGKEKLEDLPAYCPQISQKHK